MCGLTVTGRRCTLQARSRWDCSGSWPTTSRVLARRRRVRKLDAAGDNGFGAANCRHPLLLIGFGTLVDLVGVANGSERRLEPRQRLGVGGVVGQVVGLIWVGFQ